MTKSLFAAAAVLALACAGQAAAEDALVAPTQAVSTANVNFRDQAAVKAFYNRIQIAAGQVCDSNSANPRVTQRDALCVRDAVAKAVRAADRPLLTAMYDTSGEARASR
jgi:UrcA family protein